jgi:hypothetical protein
MRQRKWAFACLVALLAVSLQPALAGLLTTGQRVVLLQSDPPGGTGLLAGSSGTVICCNAGDCPGSVLISWDFWTALKSPVNMCVSDADILYPTKSAIWVDPSQVLLGTPFNQCGTIYRTSAGCACLAADDGKTYNLFVDPNQSLALNATSGAVHFGSRVRVHGLLNTTPPKVFRICPQQSGDIYHPIFSPCTASPDGGTMRPDTILINLGGSLVECVLDPDAPGPGYAYVGCVDVEIELNFRALLSVVVTPAPGVGGTWSGTVTPNVVGPGTVTVQICVQVVHLDISTLPGGGHVQVATAQLYAVPY